MSPGLITQTQGRGLDRLSPIGPLTTWVDTSGVVDIDSSKRVAELLKGAGCTQRSYSTKICSGIGATAQACGIC